jgi:putative chitinase
MIADAPDFEADPTALEEFPWALLAGISYWRRRHINADADRDDVVAVTRKINGGTNGLAERKRYLATAKGIWLDGHAESGPSSAPVLRAGVRGDAVIRLQNELIESGFSVVADGHFGEHTKSAVIAFQTRHGLPADGVVGPRTWAALEADRGVP